MKNLYLLLIVTIIGVGYGMAYGQPANMQIKQESVELKPDGNVELVADAQSNHLSPLEQFKSGIKAEDVKCNSNLLLAIKLDYSPACITKTTAVNLFLRGWAHGFVNYEPVYFVKPNSTTQISVKYYPRTSGGGLPPDIVIQLHSLVYDTKSVSGLVTNGVNVTTMPDSIHTQSNTVVNYLLKTENVRGVYWLSILDPCVLVPIAVDLNDSDLTMQSLENQNPGDMKSCPAPEVQFQVIGILNGILKLIP